MWECHKDCQEGCGHVSLQRGSRWWLTEVVGVSEGKESGISAEMEKRWVLTQAWKVVDGMEWEKGQVVIVGRRWIGREVSWKGRNSRCCN